MSYLDYATTFSITYKMYEMLNQKLLHPEIVLSAPSWGSDLEKGDHLTLIVHKRKSSFSVTAIIVDKTEERLIVALEKE